MKSVRMPSLSQNKSHYEVKSKSTSIPTIVTKTPSTERPITTEKADFSSLEAIDKVQLTPEDLQGLSNTRSLSVSDFSYRLEQEEKLRELVYSASDHNIYELSDKTAQFGVTSGFVKRKASENDDIVSGQQPKMK